MEELLGGVQSCENKNILNSLLEQGDWFARNGRLDQSFRAYSNAFRIGVVPKERITSLVAAFLEFQRNKLCKERKEKTRAQDFQDGNNSEAFLWCSLCDCMFMKPVTLACGHTFCQVCLTEEHSFTGSVECSKCGKDVSEDLTSSVNVLLMNSIQKWFPLEYQQQVKKLQGHDYLVRNDTKSAVDCFTQVLCASTKDFRSFCWRSDAFLRAGRLDLALQDIEQACKLRPSSATTFYRKAVVLANVAKVEGVLSSKHEECVLALLRSSALAPRCDRYRQQFTESLHQLLSPTFTNLNRTLLVLKLDRAPEHDRMVEIEKQNPVDPQGYFTPSNEETESNRKLISREGDANDDVFYSCIKNCDETSFNPKCENGAVDDLNNENLKEVEDFECKLCYSLLFQPITTICGHTFCRECLERCLDHRVECPCCRTALEQYHLGVRNMEITEALELILIKYFGADYNERKKKYQEKISAVISLGKDDNPQVPIFVCTLAFPKVPCPLHIFEPRYRLMLRRCVKSGSRQFGMCLGSDDPNKNFADYGTMLNIQAVNFLPDGRSIVHTVGGRRFRVISRSMFDGYHTATVEWLQDEGIEDAEELNQLIQLNRIGHITLQTWCSQMSAEQRQCITNAIGPVPAISENLQLLKDGPDWVWWVLAALPLQDKPKLIILGMTSILERLKSVIRFLQLMLTLQRKSMEAVPSTS